MIAAFGSLAAITPTVQGDVSLWLVLAVAALNPASIAVAWMLGRDIARKDRPLSQTFVAGFLASLAGVALIWLLATFRISGAGHIARAAAGIFAVGIVTGAAWAWVASRISAVK